MRKCGVAIGVIASCLLAAMPAKAEWKYQLPIRMICNGIDSSVLSTALDLYGNGTWGVAHELRNHQMVHREEQYFMDGPMYKLGWTGYLRRNPNVRMTAWLQMNADGVHGEYHEQAVNEKGQQVVNSVSSCFSTAKVTMYDDTPLPAPTPVYQPPQQAYTPPPPLPAQLGGIPIFKDGGVWNVMVQIGPAPLAMAVDSGAADTSIPEKIAQALVDIGEAHWTGEREYDTANGKVTQKTLVIHHMVVGEHAFTNIVASVADMPLLGWSVFDQAGGKVTIDSRNQRLIFG
jgi:hypothetical protein